MNLAERKLTDLQAYIQFMEQRGHLVRVKSEVDPELELAGVPRNLKAARPCCSRKSRAAPGRC